MKKFVLIICLLFILILPAQSETEFFDGFWNNTKSSFTEEKIYFHLSAYASTPVIIYSGADAKVHHYFDNRFPSQSFQPGVVLGYLAPLLLGGGFYAYGSYGQNKESLGASYAVTQTTLITLSYISLLKGITGRPPPDRKGISSIRDQSEEFNFGFLRRGVYWGWPSGHLGTTTALAATLTHYYPEKTWVKVAAYGTTSYMLFTVIAHNNGQMHWFSDAVAGAFVGYAIGSSVGTNMRKKYTGLSDKNTVNYHLVPMIGPDLSGVQVVWAY